MKPNSYNFVATIIALLFLAVALPQAANAEDDYGYQADQQANAAAQGYDNNYVVPPAYEGEYYPQETEGAIGYHGTNNTSDASAAPSEDPYYLYYY